MRTNMMRTNLEWGRTRATSFLLALGLMASTTSGASELSGELDPKGDVVYEGYAYGVYEIEASGGKLSVSMNASGLDAYLILRSPEETFRTNDDSGEGRNARIEVSEPGAGTWIAIATSYSSARGRYSLVIEGASHVARVDPEDVDAELVEAAFSVRGVVNREQDGFALVTQLEQTNAAGVPLDGVARWSTDVAEMKEFSLVEYLRALLTAPPGYYRVLTFITTSIPFSTTGARGRFATIERWSRTGHNHLPNAVREMVYSDDHRVTVLVYEFLKEPTADEPFTSVPGRFTAREHLERSGLLAILQ